MSELKVGLLALAALASVVYMSYRVTSRQSGLGKHLTYKTILKDATGIFEKSAIRVAGINSGKITNIELKDNKALLTFELRDEVKLTAGSKILVKSLGLLGDRYLDVRLADQSQDRLPEGSMIESGIAGGMSTVADDAGAMMAEIKDVMKSVKESIKTEKSDNVIKEILENIRQLSSSLKRVSNRNEETINDIMDDINRISSQLAFETDRYQDDSLMNDLDKIGPILAKLDRITGDLKLIVGDVKDGKGTVGKLLRDEYVVDQVEETLSGVNRLVNRITQIESELALFTGVNTGNGSETRFDMDIYPAPERFFRIGIVTNEFGPELVDEKETTTTVNGGSPTVTTTREVDKNAFKFNLQIGRRIQRLGIRAGLFQSTGGVGFDYHFPDYGLRTSLEVFDYQEDAGPNVRLVTELRLWNVFYGRIAGEDLISKSGEQTMTISAGLRFTDQDLAALIGLMAR